MIGVCAPAVVTGIFSKAAPFRRMLRLVLNFFVCFIFWGLERRKDKSGRAWVIGVCAPAVVTGIYKEDALVFPDVTCSPDSELKFFH